MTAARDAENHVDAKQHEITRDESVLLIRSILIGAPLFPPRTTVLSRRTHITKQLQNTTRIVARSRRLLIHRPWLHQQQSSRDSTKVTGTLNNLPISSS